MKTLHNKRTLLHNPRSQKEGPYRLQGFPETVSDAKLNRRLASAERSIRSLHHPEHVLKVIRACESNSKLAESRLSPSSYAAVVASCALAMMAAEEHAFAVTRPPGHHATAINSGGYCLFNNIALAVAHLLRDKKRVCIIDFDGHHGNGTQAFFRDENRVMFASIHQDKTYPHSGAASNIGKGPSLKKAINIPLPEGSGDDVFLTALTFVAKRFKAFKPDFVAVSAGFDGYHGDRLLKLNYSKQGYYEAGKVLASIGKPVFGVLEGGYHTEIKGCVDAFISGVERKKDYQSGEKLSVSNRICREKSEETLRKIERLIDTR
jgi:acetoin utilization deacetylase AcuC-like enzyme